MSSTPQRQLRFFQFRLRSLFIFTLVVAILAWLITVIPGDFWFILLLPTLPIVTLTASILGVIYLREGWRAFWVGYGISLIQIILLGLFFDIFDRPGLGELEMIVFVPGFVIVVPAMTGGIGFYFYRKGQHRPEIAPPSTEQPAGDVQEAA